MLNSINKSGFWILLEFPRDDSISLLTTSQSKRVPWWDHLNSTSVLVSVILSPLTFNPYFMTSNLYSVGGLWTTILSALPVRLPGEWLIFSTFKTIFPGSESATGERVSQSLGSSHCPTFFPWILPSCTITTLMFFDIFKNSILYF